MVLSPEYSRQSIVAVLLSCLMVTAILALMPITEVVAGFLDNSLNVPEGGVLLERNGLSLACLAGMLTITMWIGLALRWKDRNSDWQAHGQQA
jgi:hypothetical protein